MIIEYVLFFYMLGIGLVTYIFHRMEERGREVLSTQHNNLELTLIVMLGSGLYVFLYNKG